MQTFETKLLPEKPEYLAPDGSEIRELPRLSRGSLAHCVLPPGKTSSAVKHKTIEEIWYFIQGEGKVWRKMGDVDQEVDVHPGVSLTIPPGAHFQFRNTGSEPLCFVIATMPPRPGDNEAVRVDELAG